MSISEQLREAIFDESDGKHLGRSRYRLCQQTDGIISQSHLSGFLNGTVRLSQDKLDLLADLLGLELVRRVAADASETEGHTDVDA